ncbi:hypothetical protein [Actinoplanes sp. CA-252034]|uniref:hypothetical protein n=1 Tax=Actinoplanes sp. CA-252034 TaxID=3239906 RepID=UPI003D96AF1D
MALFDDAFAADPHPALAALREAGPVHRVTSAAGIPFWMVTRWDEARQVLTDPSLSKQQPVDQLPPGLREALATQMLLRDPPDHTRLRRLVSAAFTPRRIQELAPDITRITDRLLDDMATAAEPDLIGRFAVPLPLEVICELLGIPASDRGSFHTWSSAIISGGGGPADMLAAMSAIVGYFRELLADKRARPADDLLSALTAIADDGDRLSEDELVGMALLLLIAGPRDHGQPDRQRRPPALRPAGSARPRGERSGSAAGRGGGDPAVGQPGGHQHVPGHHPPDHARGHHDPGRGAGADLAARRKP